MFIRLTQRQFLLLLASDYPCSLRVWAEGVEGAVNWSYQFFRKVLVIHGF